MCIIRYFDRGEFAVKSQDCTMSKFCNYNNNTKIHGIQILCDSSSIQILQIDSCYYFVCYTAFYIVLYIWLCYAALSATDEAFSHFILLLQPTVYENINGFSLKIGFQDAILLIKL